MRHPARLALLLVVLLASFALLPQALRAANFTLSGRVTDQSSNPVVGATVAALDSSNTTIASATTDSSGNYSMSLAGGTYTIQVTPPSGSGFQTSDTPNESITADTTLNFVLVPAGSVTLSGRVLDGQGNPLPGQTVLLFPPGGGSFRTGSDSMGHYSISVAPGNYTLSLQNSNAPNPVSAAAPMFYELTANTSLSLTQDTNLDLSLPVQRVTVHVQDPAGSPVANVQITTSSPGTVNLPFAGQTGHGQSSYPNCCGATLPTTDASGNAVLWLFATSPGNGFYGLTIIPPSGSPFVQTNLPNVAFATDITEAIVLQFVHAPPVTTATTNPQAVNGVYPGPVTVTLSATATSGFTVANTFYTVDGGAQQTYTAPFPVSGNGAHTVVYHSVDSADVFELNKTLNITIAPLSITTTSPLPAGTQGTAYSTTLQASGGSGSYTWSLANGSTLPANLTLDPNSGVISGTPVAGGTTSFFTVQVNDGSTSATKDFSLVINSLTPQIANLSPANANAGSGAFTLAVNGSGFTTTSVVNWNGTALTTTYVSATQLSAAVPGSDIATPGTAQVTVVNPAPGGPSNPSRSRSTTRCRSPRLRCPTGQWDSPTPPPYRQRAAYSRTPGRSCPARAICRRG